MVDKGFKVEIPISVGGGKSNVGKKLADDFLKSIKGSFAGFGSKKKKGGSPADLLPGIGKIAASVGIIAAIWQGISPILKPVLKMLSILLTLLLLPLMPLIKQMVSGLAKTAGKVSEAQKEAGGGYAGFIAGMAELMKSPTIWALAGVGLAASFVASLGTLGIVGLIMGLISVSLIWESITSGDETTLSEKLKTAGWAGLSAGIAALIFGAGIYALPVGALVFGLSLGVSMLGSAMQEEDLGKALLEAAGGSLMLGLVAGAIVVLLGLGLGAAGIVTLAVGAIVFTLFASWKIFGGKGEGMKTIEETLGDQMTVIKDFTFDGPEIDMSSFETGITDSQNNFVMLNDTISTELIKINSSINTSSINMADVSVEATNQVIENLSRIPTEITTTHYIRTVQI